MISKVANCSKFRDNGFEKTAGGANMVSNFLGNVTSLRNIGNAFNSGGGLRSMLTHSGDELASLAAYNGFNKSYNGLLEGMLKSNPGMSMEQATQVLANQGIHQMGTMIPQAGQMVGQVAGQAGQQAATTIGGQIAQNAAPLAMGAAALGGTIYVGNRVFGRPNYGYGPRYY